MTSFGLQVFIPHYQPIVNLQDESIVKYESLARFFDSEGKAIGPMDVPHLFEDEDFLYDIFLRSLNVGISHAAENRTVSINVDLRNMSERFFMKIESIPKDLTAHLQFEISEKSIFPFFDNAIEPVLRLKEMGFHVALDNFGSKGGHTKHLEKIQFDTVKISSQVVQSGRGSSAWMREMKDAMEFMSTYGAEFIANEIETEKTAELIKGFGINLGQGYYFGLPKPDITCTFEQYKPTTFRTSFG